MLKSGHSIKKLIKVKKLKRKLGNGLEGIRSCFSQGERSISREKSSKIFSMNVKNSRSGMLNVVCKIRQVVELCAHFIASEWLFTLHRIVDIRREG